MHKHEAIHRLLNPGVVAVIRADDPAQLLGAARALLAGGVTAMEVTMTTPDALGVIRSVSDALGDAVLMGVGTVLDPETCRMALLAGARFVRVPRQRLAVH